jgi:Ku protein
MARSMWRGAIQFGLVTIPVKLYLATEQSGIGFNLLHASCLNRIQMKIYCPYHDEVIPRSETVRGYEWSKGKYVVVTDEDIDSVPLKTVRAIEIEMFVDARNEAHGAQFVKQAYYLEPETVGRKAFYLLKSVLADAGKTAICKIVLKDREQLAALNPYAKTMLLTTLHWPDEVRAIEELELPEDELRARIDGLVGSVDDPGRAIFNFHAPPYGSNLDDAPALDEDLQPMLGGRAMRPVGSKAVREAITEHQPLLSLHGHIHEGKGTQRMGKTLAVNPGSAYEEGVLQASIIELDQKQRKIKNYQLVTG